MNQMDEILVMAKSSMIEQNGAGTCQQIDADLTRGNPGLFAGLARLRSAHGPNSPIGHRCSNIIEMLDAGARPSDIAAQTAELAALVSKGDRA